MLNKYNMRVNIYVVEVEKIVQCGMTFVKFIFLLSLNSYLTHFLKKKNLFFS